MSITPMTQDARTTRNIIRAIRIQGYDVAVVRDGIRMTGTGRMARELAIFATSGETGEVLATFEDTRDVQATFYLTPNVDGVDDGCDVLNDWSSNAITHNILREFRELS